MTSKPKNICLTVSQALLVSFVTRQVVDHFQTAAQTTLLFLNKQPNSIVDNLVETGALSLLANRLILAFQETICSGEDSLVGAVMYLLVLRCNKHVPCEFIPRIGISFVADLIFYLQTSSKDSADLESLHRLLRQLGSLPWSMLPMTDYDKLVRLLQETLRYSVTPLICASIFDFFHGLGIDDAKKSYLIEHPGLVEDILEQADHFLSYNKDAAHQVASTSSRLLRRLAWRADNRAKLASKRGWTKVLVTLAGNPDQNIKEEALETIRYMSTAVKCRRDLLKYHDSALIHCLVDSLDHPKLEHNSLQTLSILVDSCVVKKLISYEGIFSRLASVAREKENRLATKAAQILKNAAKYISVRDDGHKELLDALIFCADSPRRHVRLWAIKGLQVQSESSVNSFFLARNDTSLQSIISLSQDPDRDVRKTALLTLLNVATEISNTRRAATSTKYLDAFVSNALMYLANDDEEVFSITRLSIRAILKLSDHPKCHYRVAKQKGVVESLARYGISPDSDIELKSAALHAVLLLTPFM